MRQTMSLSRPKLNIVIHIEVKNVKTETNFISASDKLRL